MNEVRSIKSAYASHLLAKKNVVAVGVGYKRVGGERTDDLAVIVSVVQKQTNPVEPVPKYLNGIKTDVQEVGVLRAMRTSKHRPAPGGVSIGHVDITAGTLGCLTSEGYILSNNHVLANSNAGEPGDYIVQPGPHDGGTVDDLIATLYRFVPVEFSCPILDGIIGAGNLIARAMKSRYRLRGVNNSENLVDAALATPLSSDLVTPEILEIGEPAGVAEAELGMSIQKSGRTTGLTHGTIEQIDVTANVLYGYQMATFTDQVMAGYMCEGGDSGSAVLTGDREVVGLLFAGSESTTLFNRIANVTDLLGVTI